MIFYDVPISYFIPQSMNDVHVNLVISVVNKPIEPGRIMTMNYPLENQYLRWSVVMVDIGGLTHWGQDTKWPPFCRQHFQMHFLEWKHLKSDYNFNCIPKGWIKNIPALVQIMAWHRLGGKPLPEPMMVSLLMHICFTWSQWVNSLVPWIFWCKFKYVIF